MKRSYQVSGIDTDPIKLQVNVGTTGIAYTAVFQSKSGGQRSLLAESTADNANISERSIGTSGGLKNSYIIIQTVITLGAAAPGDWQNIVRNIFIEYKLMGGIAGTMNFNYDTDDVTVSSQGKVLVIGKPIEIKS